MDTNTLEKTEEAAVETAEENEQLEEVTPYRRKKDSLEQELQDLEKARDEAVSQSDSSPIERLEKAVQEDPDISLDEKTWAKRHGDLRRHSQQKQEEYEKKLAEMETVIAELKAKVVEVDNPVNKEQLEQFKEENPDVYNIMIATAREHAQALYEQKSEPLRAELEEVKKARKAAEHQAEVAKVKEAHPDLEKLSGDVSFLDWLDEQPKEFSSAVTEGTNAKAAILVLNAYKAEKGITASPTEHTPNTNKGDAAETVRKRGPKAPVGRPKKQVYSEEDIRNMTLEEYQEKEAEILLARKQGRYHTR